MIRLILIIIIVLIMACLLISVIDMNRFVVRRYDVSPRNCKKDLRIVHISDLHNRSYGDHNEKLKNRIEELNPDMIVMSGDMMTAGHHRHTEDNADDLVLSLSAKYPVYFSLGNHEDKIKNRTDTFGSAYADSVKRYEDAGVHVLDNMSTDDAEKGLHITGLNISRKYYRRNNRSDIKKDDIISIVGENDKKLMNLMIAHNPIYFPSYKQWGADLVLSGHIHGGIIRIPGIGGLLSPDCTFFPKYDGGMFSEDGATMIVSRGLGTHTIPIRIFNPGELVCVDIHAKSATTKADNQDR